MAGIDERLTAFDSYYYEGVAAPDTETITGTVLRTEREGIAGTQEVRVIAATAFTVPDTTSLSISLQSSATSGGTYTTLQTFYDETASGDIDFAAGDVIAKTTIPVGAQAWTRVSLTASGTCTGTIDGFLAYVPG